MSRAASPSSAPQPLRGPEEASLHGYPVVLPQAMIGRLDALARKAFEAIRAGLVKRGRKQTFLGSPS